ncbi:MAG: orotate phosphoribosyltransferase [Leadbetterella sp.]
MRNTAYFPDLAQDLLGINVVNLNFSHPFTWVSGVKSPIYCDNRIINSHVEVRDKVTNGLVKLIKDKFPETEIVAGVATGGIPLGILAADRLRLPFIYARQAKKEYGMGKQVEGVFEKGNKIVLIEDHVSTGSSSMKVVDILREEGIDVLGIVSVMTYRFQKSLDIFDEANLPNYSLCDLDAIADYAQQTGEISPEQSQSLLIFRDNPSEWYKG